MPYRCLVIQSTHCTGYWMGQISFLCEGELAVTVTPQFLRVPTVNSYVRGCQELAVFLLANLLVGCPVEYMCQPADLSELYSLVMVAGRTQTPSEGKWRCVIQFFFLWQTHFSRVHVKFRAVPHKSVRVVAEVRLCGPQTIHPYEVRQVPCLSRSRSAVPAPRCSWRDLTWHEMEPPSGRHLFREQTYSPVVGCRLPAANGFLEHITVSPCRVL